VDIIQAFGAMTLDLPAQFVDIAAGSSYKWLCAPEGCGIFYLNERASERIYPSSRGWTSVENAWNFSDREQPMVRDSRGWETGMGGSALFYGVEESLKILSQANIDWIEAYLGELTDFFCERVRQDRFEIVSSRDRGEKSQIVAIRPLNGHTSCEIVKRLAENDIIVSSRGDCIRVAPHFFNNFDDIERLVDALP
jgi:selenocysteine lyase/cysteine desulfurase